MMESGSPRVLCSSDRNEFTATQHAHGAHHVINGESRGLMGEFGP